MKTAGQWTHALMIKFLTAHKPSDRQWLAGAILFSAYFIANVLGSRSFTAPAVISAAAGVALAGLVLEGVTLWPAIYTASLASYLFTHAGNVLLFPVIILPAAAAIQAIAGALLLKRLEFDLLMNHIRDGIAFICTALLTSMIVPTFGMLSYQLNRAVFNTPIPVLTWNSWWCGTITSVIVIAPFLMRWIIHPEFVRNLQDWIEIAAAFSLLSLIIIPAAFTPLTEIGGVSLIYLLLIPLFWIAIRLGPRFMMLANLFVAVCAIAGIFWGTNSVADASRLGVVVFETQILVITLSCIFLVLVGSEEERKDALVRARARMARLESDFGAVSFRDRTKSEFIAVLAHELRNPLAPIVSSLDILRMEGGVSARHAPILDEMDSRVRTIRRLLDDILDISRISQNKFNLQRESIKLQDVVASALRAVESRIAERAQRLSLNMIERPILVNGDAVRLEQIFTNILTNACKFTKSQGHISVSVYQEGPLAEVHIRDDGAGIESGMLEPIFEPFLQVEGKGASDGLGIGLALAKQLVEMHEGSIEAKSKGLGHGSEFIVRIPALGTPDTPERDWLDESTGTPISNTAESHRARKILVVDDNASAANLIARLLHHLGYAVQCAYSGTEAIEESAVFKPEIIILDIGLPDMDGYATAETIRKKNHFSGTLIALTGYGQEEDRAKAYAAGFDHHLTKPVNIADLQGILLKSLQRK